MKAVSGWFVLIRLMFHCLDNRGPIVIVHIIRSGLYDCVVTKFHYISTTAPCIRLGQLLPKRLPFWQPQSVFVLACELAPTLTVDGIAEPVLF